LGFKTLHPAWHIGPRRHFDSNFDKTIKKIVALPWLPNWITN